MALLLTEEMCCCCRFDIEKQVEYTNVVSTYVIAQWCFMLLLVRYYQSGNHQMFVAQLERLRALKKLRRGKQRRAIWSLRSQTPSVSKCWERDVRGRRKLETAQVGGGADLLLKFWLIAMAVNYQSGPVSLVDVLMRRSDGAVAVW